MSTFIIFVIFYITIGNFVRLSINAVPDLRREFVGFDKYTAVIFWPLFVIFLFFFFLLYKFFNR